MAQNLIHEELKLNWNILKFSKCHTEILGNLIHEGLKQIQTIRELPILASYRHVESNTEELKRY